MAETKLGTAQIPIRATLGDLDKDLDGARGKVEGALGGIADLGTIALGAALASVKEIAGTIGDTFKQIFEFGEEGARINQLNESFVTMIGSGDEAAAMERALGEAVHGTMDGEQMQSAILKMLAGATGVFADRVKETAPLIFQMAAASAKLNPMLGDTTSVLEAMSSALETGATKGLKRYGIIVDAAKSEAIYAASIGKTVKELDEEEVKTAHLNAALEYLPKLMAQVGGTTDSAVDPFNRMKAALDDVGDAVSTKLAPGIASAADAIALLLTWDKKLADAMADHERQVGKTSASYEDYIVEMQRAYAATGALIDSEGRQGELVHDNDTGLNEYIWTQRLVTKEQYELAKATEVVTSATNESVQSLSGITAAAKTYNEQLKKDADAAQKLADAQARIADAWFASVTKIKEGNDKYASDRADLEDQLAKAQARSIETLDAGQRAYLGVRAAEAQGAREKLAELDEGAKSERGYLEQRIADIQYEATEAGKGSAAAQAAKDAEIAKIREKITALDAEREKSMDAQAASMIKPEMFASVDAYTEAKRKLLLATGQATAASFAEQDAQSLLAVAYGAGQITAEQYELGIRKIPEAARDGVVGIGELVASLSGTKFSLKNLDDSATAVKEKTKLTYLDAGREAPLSAAQGVTESTPVFASAIGMMASAGIFAFQDKLLMHSPSLVFAGLGSELMAGLAQGVIGSSALVQVALQGIAGETLLPFAVALGDVKLAEEATSVAMLYMATVPSDILRKALDVLNFTMGGAGGTISDLEMLKGIAASSGGTIAGPLEASFYIVRNAAAEAGSAVGGVLSGLEDIKAIGNITNIITTVHIDIYRTREEGGGAAAPAAPGEQQGTPTSAPGHAGGGGEQQGMAVGGSVAAGIAYLVGERQPEIFVPDVAGRIIPNAQQFMDQLNSAMGRVVQATTASASELIARNGGDQGGAAPQQHVTIYGLTLEGVQNARGLLGELQAMT